MEIRSVTLFAEPTYDPQQAAAFFTAARASFEVPVQTIRLATTPFPVWWNPDHYAAMQVADFLEAWQPVALDFISLGPVKLHHDAGWLNHLPDLIGTSKVIHYAVEIADQTGMIDVGRCKAAAEIIRRLSWLHSDGTANMQFAALANCPPGIPFFNAAYHRGGSAHFALAIEGADLAVQAFTGSATLLSAQQALTAAIEAAAAKMVGIATGLAADFNIAFSGLDFTMAPFPSDDRSLAAALEGLGLVHLGAPGSIFAAAFTASAVAQADFPRCGFSGLMFPVLEDSVLAQRAADGQVSLSDLLAYAAVCGDGLDTIPLPGDTDQGTLTGILLDIAALATRLNKPLVARLLPMPGLAAGDPVSIEWPWFAPARVMALDNAGLGRPLNQTTRTHLRPYHES